MIVLFIGGFGYMMYNYKANAAERALALAAMGNFLDAKGIARDLIESDPQNPRYLFLMSKIYAIEKDVANESLFLEKLKKLGKYDEEDFPAVFVNNRIGDIHFQQNQFREAFFYYLDTLEADPNNLDSLLKLSFMAVGQKEFKIAELFMKRIAEEKVEDPNFFIARGVVAAMLNRAEEITYFEKAYQLDKTSPTANLLLALSHFRLKNYKEALDHANPVAENTEDELLRYFVFQFIMVQNSLLEDYQAAMVHARLGIEIAKQNGWQFELAESELHYAMFAIKLDKIEEASEYLIEAESISIHDEDIISLANFKAKLEEMQGKAPNYQDEEYNLEESIAELAEKLIPVERIYEFSRLRSNDHINIRGMVNEEGKKIISSLSNLAPDVVSRFTSLTGINFKNACNRLMSELHFKHLRELACVESDGANFLASHKDNEEHMAIFRIRKWKDAKISDVFLNEAVESMSQEEGVRNCYIIGFAELTSGARKIQKNHKNELIIITDKELERLLEKVFAPSSS